MYTKHYNLKTKPFRISSDPDFLWLGDKHKEALATLKYGVLDNKGFMLLTGDVGTGKTTLINALIKSLSDDILYASVTDPRLELLDFLNYIAMAFGITKDFESKGKFLLYFKKFLEQAYEQGKKVLLLIDESQLLTQDLLEEIRLLSNIQRDGNNLLNIFFVGQDEFNEILERSENRAVAQRLTLNYHLSPLSEQETAEYIRYRLNVAGTKKQLFNREAVRQVYIYSGGFPRRINIICDHCLLNGFVKEKNIIDAAMVQACAQDLKIPKYQKNRAVLQPQPRPIPPAVKQVPSPHPSPRPPVARERVRKEKKTSAWPVAVTICLGLVLLLYFLSPATFSAMFDEVEQLLVLGKEKMTGTLTTAPVTNVSTPPVEESKTPVQQSSEKELPGPDGGNQNGISDTPSGSQIPDTDTEVESAVTERTVPVPVEQMPKTPESDLPGKQSRVQTNPLDMVGESEPFDDNARGEFTETQIPVTQDQPSFPEQQAKSVEPPSQQDRIAAETNSPIPNKTVMVRFDPDSSDFYFADVKHVDAFVEAIKNHPKATVVISGHTDSYGSESYNYKLSLFRANMLKSFFLGKGIQPDKLIVKGFGSTKPIATNETPEGRRQNRRVEIDIVR